MISLDWKERLVTDSIDFIERKIPKGDFDFDIIYNAYPARSDNKIPRDVVIFVANTLGLKMLKKHKDYLPFCDFIWHYKGINGKIMFACIISKFIRKDYNFYFEFTKKYIMRCKENSDIALLLEKVLLPILKKQPIEHAETLVKWLCEDNEKINQLLIKIILRVGKDNPDFIKKFINRLEYRWYDASPELVKLNGLFLKSLSKVDYETYLAIYKDHKSTREPIFVEILTLGLANYDDILYEIYENWGKSVNARLKKAAQSGLKYLNKRRI